MANARPQRKTSIHFKTINHKLCSLTKNEYSERLNKIQQDYEEKERSVTLLVKNIKVVIGIGQKTKVLTTCMKLVQNSIY